MNASTNAGAPAPSGTDLQQQVQALTDQVRVLEQKISQLTAAVQVGAGAAGADPLARKVIGGFAALLHDRRHDEQTARMPLIKAILKLAAPLVDDSWPTPSGVPSANRARDMARY